MNAYERMERIKKGTAFELSKEQVDAFKAWDEQHKNEKHGGRYPYVTFSFTGTSIGEIATVRCAHCGEEKDLTDYDHW